MASQTWAYDLAFNQVGPFTAVTAASITALCPDITVPQLALSVGSKLRATLYGKVTTAASSPGTFTLQAMWGGTGGTSLCSSGALTYVASATNIPWKLEFLMVCQAISTAIPPTYSIFTQGMFTTTTAVLATPAFALIPASAPAVVASLSSSSTALDFNITMSAATNSITCDLFTLESLSL